MGDASLKLHAYQHIKSKLLDCVYQPGQFLNEKQLSEELNTSRTPIREAIIMLEQENYVKILPKRGVMVCDVTAKRLADAYEVRIILESYALRHHHDEYDAAEINQLIQSFESYLANPIPDALDVLDERFHAAICRYNNSYISAIMRDVRDQNARMRKVACKPSGDKQDATREYLEILHCLRRQDFWQAEKLLVQHLENERHAAIERLTTTL